MDVGNRHENGNHQAAVVEILVFFHLFNHHHLAISGCHHYPFHVAGELAERAAEEIDCNAVKHNAGCRKHIEWKQTNVFQGKVEY